MMIRRLVATVAIVAVMGAGCTPPSMNVRRSGIRSGGDLAVTVTLDRLDQEQAVASIKPIVDTCDMIERILADPSGWTFGGLVEKVKAEAPIEARFILDELVKRIGVDQYTAEINPEIAKYILALSRGARQAANSYSVEDRKEAN